MKGAVLYGARDVRLAALVGEQAMVLDQPAERQRQLAVEDRRTIVQADVADERPARALTDMAAQPEQVAAPPGAAATS